MKSFETGSTERQLFIRALEKAPGIERAAFLDRACANNPELRQRLELLLEKVEGLGSFLEEPAVSGPGPPHNSSAPEPLQTTVQTVTVNEKTGDRIGRYKLLQQIGEGGCGVVYMAEQEEPVRRRVALKVIRLGMDTKNVIARFEAERQALALMDHPNIAKVLDAGATETGRPYFVMELVRGIKITDYCDQNNLPTQQRLELFIQICRAIQHAHQKGIIHRDIKPSNILVTIHDGIPLPKVIDFGIAKATTDVRLTDKTLFTQFEQFIGTPAYMSPEQAEMGGLDIDTRSDIYSLGVLLYELLTGKTPFDPKDLLALGLDEMRRTIREKEPARPSTRLGTMQAEELTTTAKRRACEGPKLISALRGDLDWIVMKALEKDRTRRYETANGLAMDLERHLNNEPVTARPPGMAYRLQKAVRRHKLAFTAAAAVSIALLVGTVVSIVEAVAARRAERTAETAKVQAQKAQLIATQESKLAKEEGERADSLAVDALQSLYESDMILAHQAADQGNLGLARNLLEKHRPKPHAPDLRGWEWRHLWGLCQSDELQVVATNSGSKVSLALSRDGRLLSAAQSISATSAVYLWEFPSGRLLAMPETNDASGSVDFSPDGKLLAFGTRNHGIQLWDIAASRQWTNFPGIYGNGWFSVLQFSPDGRYLAASRASPQVVVWDVTTHREAAVLTNHSEFVGALSFSPDGTMLATGSFDNTLRIWSVATWKPIGDPLTGHEAAPFSLAFSPDGRILASSSWDQKIGIWDVTAQTQIHTLTNHTGLVTSVAFSPDQKILASGSIDFTIRLWDTTSWEEADVLRGSPDEIWAVAFVLNGKELVSGGKDGAIRTWSALPTPRKLHQLDRPSDAEDWGICGGILYCGHTNGTITYWNATTLRQIAQYTCPQENRTNSIARDFSPSGKLVWANNQSEVVVWDLAAGRQITRLPWVSGSSKFVKISPGEKMLVGGAPDARSLTVWDFEKSVETATMPKSEESDPAARGSHVNGVDVLSFSADSRLFAYGNWNGTVEVWDLSRKARVALWPVHHEPISGLAFMPDGKRIVSLSTDANVKLWDIDTGRELKAFSRAFNRFESLAVTPDGLRVAGTTSDGLVKIWNVTTGQEVTTLKLGWDVPFAGTVVGMQFLPPDGDTLLVCTTAKARIWHAPSWPEIHSAEAKQKAAQISK
jgi:WD40 repeat protein